jgi:hypothetical protein
MGRTRSIYFEYNYTEEHISFGTFALCMYYASQLNTVKTKKLMEATISEWSFRVEYELPKGGLTSDDEEAHFVSSEIQEVITFLENDLIPALNNETQDLLEQYDGKSNFINLYYNNAEFLKFNGISENEFFDSDGETLAHYMNRLKIILQYYLSENEPFITYVR